MENILHEFDIEDIKQFNYEIIKLNSGLIHNTWKIIVYNRCDMKNEVLKGNAIKVSYILQQFNDDIFKNPSHISENIEVISNFLNNHYPEYSSVTPVPRKYQPHSYYYIDSTESESVSEVEKHSQKAIYYRMFMFIEDTVVYQVVETSKIAFEASKSFAKFTKLLSCDMNTNTDPDDNMAAASSSFNGLMLHVTLPDFHNLTMRYAHFMHVIAVNVTNTIDLKEVNMERLQEPLVQEYISYICMLKESIVDVYDDIVNKPLEYKNRVMHHDTKISNVLFDNNGNAKCVIDLDTVMHGLLISDVGDMIRTYACPVDENHSNFDDITIRSDYVLAIVDGYLSEIGADLTRSELKCFIYAGKFMIYMQSIRFLCDYIQNDVYYSTTTVGQNLIRTGNQLMLLKQLIGTEKELQLEIDKLLFKYHLI